MTEFLTGQDLIKYEQKFGKSNLSNIVKVLDSVRPFNTAIQSDLGKELSKDLLKTIRSMLPKIMDMSATEEERLFFKCYLSIFYRWEEKILVYEKGVYKIKTLNK